MMGKGSWIVFLIIFMMTLYSDWNLNCTGNKINREGKKNLACTVLIHRFRCFISCCMTLSEALTLACK
jgi:hypothetical protein